MNISDLKYLAEEAASRGFTVELLPEGVRVSTRQGRHNFHWCWDQPAPASHAFHDGLDWLDRKVAESP